MKRHAQTSASPLPPDFIRSARGWWSGLISLMLVGEAVFGIFQRIALADLKPIVQSFLQPQAGCDQEEPC